MSNGGVWITALLVLGPTALFVGLVVLVHRLLPPVGAYSMAAMAITVFAARSVVYMVDRPFNDRGAAIGTARMENALRIMSRDAPSPIPCDLHGTPVA